MTCSSSLYSCQDLTINLRPCPETPNHSVIEVVTPYGDWSYGDYPEAEAHERATHLIQSRMQWSPERNGGFWYPDIWQIRDYFRGGVEFHRRGPEGTELCVHQPHGGPYWSVYWGTLPIVGSPSDKNMYDTAWEAMGALDNFATDGMRNVLFE